MERDLASSSRLDEACSWILRVEGLSKSFVLHVKGKTKISVFHDLNFTLRAGESIGLVGPSGAGKSSLLKVIYGNYRADGGHIWLQHKAELIDIAGAPAHQILEIRRWTIGYVSQFLRAIPRVPTLDIVMEPLLMRGIQQEEAREKAVAILQRLGIPERLWDLSPTTFSGGEQQRVNIARVFVAEYPLLLLDEPTASLDPANRDIVLELIAEARLKGAAILGIYHDESIRNVITTRILSMAEIQWGKLGLSTRAY